jgi:hypothetical protein
MHMYERFLIDKPNSENRSFECTIFELPRQNASSNRYWMTHFGEPFISMNSFLRLMNGSENHSLECPVWSIIMHCGTEKLGPACDLSATIQEDLLFVWLLMEKGGGLRGLCKLCELCECFVWVVWLVWFVWMVLCESCELCDFIVKFHSIFRKQYSIIMWFVWFVWLVWIMWILNSRPDPKTVC